MLRKRILDPKIAASDETISAVATLATLEVRLRIPTLLHRATADVICLVWQEEYGYDENACRWAKEDD